MNESPSYNFKNYREESPSGPGWYIWRMPHKFIKDVTLIFLAKYRERWAGFETVLSPQFDHWDGYRITLPKGPIEWSDYDGEEPKPGHELIEVVGADNLICPFCKKEPKWRYSGRYIGAGPTDTDYFYLECCHWFDGFKSRMKNPVKLTEERNAALSVQN